MVPLPVGRRISVQRLLVNEDLRRFQRCFRGKGQGPQGGDPMNEDVSLDPSLVKTTPNVLNFARSRGWGEIPAAASALIESCITRHRGRSS
jgi:hypothetical protein